MCHRKDCSHYLVIVRSLCLLLGFLSKVYLQFCKFLHRQYLELCCLDTDGFRHAMNKWICDLDDCWTYAGFVLLFCHMKRHRGSLPYYYVMQHESLKSSLPHCICHYSKYCSSLKFLLAIHFNCPIFLLGVLLMYLVLKKFILFGVAE